MGHKKQRWLISGYKSKEAYLVCTEKKSLNIGKEKNGYYDHFGPNQEWKLDNW